MESLPKVALALAAALLLLLPAAAVGAAESAESGRDGDAIGALGRAVLAAAASASNADEALGAVGSGLALMEASERLEAEREKAASAAPAYDPPGPIVPGDPSTLPPASAGSNGTEIARHSAAEREKIFASARAADDSTSILLTGIALPPPNAPQAVQDVIDNANAIVGRPYIWGGGHGSWYSHGYDCSGAVSFALFGGGMIPRPLTSSELEGWDAPRPRPVDHGLRQRLPHLRRDRRPALGHLGR